MDATNPAPAFVCAMPMELRPLAKRLALQRSEVNGTTVSTGLLGRRPVMGIVTGMGTESARRGVERLLAACAVERVLVVGIAGALESHVPIGKVVIPEVVLDGATGAELRPTPLGGTVAQGQLWTSDELITDPERLEALRGRGVVALDMETAAVGAVCEAQGIPWSVFRVISDRASDGTLDEETFQLANQDGTPDAGAAARYFLRHPGQIPRLVRLARGARLAAQNAADAAIGALSSV
jgi:adenosylhomocysteine nucleosidase